MTGESEGTVWPLPKFYFSVDIGDVAANLPFQEVTGLDIETQTIEYRAGDAKVFNTLKMPTIVKASNVTMKKGIFARDSKFFDWYNSIKMNVIKRQDVTIRLLDELGTPTMVWKLTNAWPSKITGTDLKSDGNEIAVETIEFAHEGITITNG
jgi:phage tail-like protein